MTDFETAIGRIDMDELSAWVNRQRWFSARSDDPVIEIRHAQPLTGGGSGGEAGLGLVLVEARTHDGNRDLFQLVVTRDGESIGFDALAEPTQAVPLAELLTDQAVIEGPHGTIRFRTTDLMPALADPPRSGGA